MPVKTGGVTSDVHITVLDTLDVLPQASDALNVLDCEILHSLLTTTPSVNVTVSAPQASVAFAPPSASVIEFNEGLQRRFIVP